MQKEKVSDQAVLNYDEYKSVRSMLLSENKTDRTIGLDILENVDQKKCLPFILFTALEFSRMENHAAKSVIWSMYGRMSCFNVLSKLIDVTSDSISYNNPDRVKIGSHGHPTAKYFELNTNNYFSRIVERISITYIIDTIVKQDDPERFYPLEKDIEKFIIDKYIKEEIILDYKLDIPGFTMKFDIKKAIEIRTHELTKK
jgi:hypothetical protein